MNFEGFKKFRPADGERYIIVENGEPTVVLLSFRDYQKISTASSGRKIDNQQPVKTISSKEPDIGGWNSGSNEFAENAENVDDNAGTDNNDFIPEPKGAAEEREKLLEGQEDSGEVPKNELTVEDLPF